ncbi:MAG: Do family serine endopeptidase [Granulosicoccaceae bacterium]
MNANAVDDAIVSTEVRTTTVMSRIRSHTRIYRNTLILILLMPFLAVTKSYADTLPDFSALVDQEGDAVVKISVLTESTSLGRSGIPGGDLDQLPEYLRKFYEQLPQNQQPSPRRGGGFGSGFIVSEDGYVITNAHVVNNAIEIRIGLKDRREYDATLIGLDKSSDIAVLKVNANNLPVVKIGDSDDLRVGEWVLAIGSPFGFEQTATQGIVSALGRSLPDETYVPFIQTDAAVNPGNSGGPLFNTDGEVIGVNSQIYSRSGGYQGLSFSIPINVAMSIADQLKSNGYATRGWLGVMIQDVNQDLAESFGLSKPEGALVAQVASNGPAEKSGIEAGDILISFNGKKVLSSNALPPLVGAVKPGETVKVLVIRDGSEKIIDVEIGALEADLKASKAVEQAGMEESKLGAVIANINDDELKELGLDTGVMVKEVTPQSAASNAGLRAGDVIVKFNRKPIESVRQLEQQLNDSIGGKATSILVQREGSPIFMALKLDSDG